MSFVRFRQAATSSTTNRRAIFTTGASSGSDVGSRDYPSRETTINTLYAHVPAAPGVGNMYTAQLKVSGVLTGPILTLSDSEITDFVTPNVVLPLAVLTDGSQIQTTPTAPPPVAQAIFFGIEYTCTFPDSDISLHGAGDESSNITLAATNRFFGIDWSGAGAATATESGAQCPWPTGGAIRYFSIAYITGVDATTSATLALRKNGADVVLFSLPGQPGGARALVTDFTSVVSVAAGDLLNWRFIRTAGASTSFVCNVVFGFTG